MLGILNDYDAPQARMLVVVHGRCGSKWSYIGDLNRGHLGVYDLKSPQYFTPLSKFGVTAVMLPDGRLRLTPITISVATYSRDGTPRPATGKATAKKQSTCASILQAKLSLRCRRNVS